MVLIRVLHETCVHWSELKTVGFWVGVLEDEEEGDGRPSRCRAKAPACGHVCATSLRCSRQYVFLHEPQWKGRKSSWPQYSYWQWRPMDSRSLSAISLLLAGLALPPPLDIDIAGILEAISVVLMRLDAVQMGEMGVGSGEGRRKI